MAKLFSNAIKRVKGVLGRGSASGDIDPTDPASIDPHIIPRDHHSISRKHISEAALRVMSILHKAGYEGFLVGGGVRDLLLGGRPKDFDIATDATPEQVNKLFRSSRIIGRRFKIVHVRFGREVIEVTTFRGTHEQTEESIKGKRPRNQQSARSKNGMLLRDNVFGTVEEDAIRRDLTINALYYTTADFAIYDYTDGLRDLEDKIIRVIGDPETRYREDPVRMLRVVRFAAKLDFDIEQETADPIYDLAPSLADIPAARMFDEVLKLFMSGKGVDVYELMQEFGLFEPLFPQIQPYLEQDHYHTLVMQALKNTDTRIRQGKPVTPAFIYAALLWPAVNERQQQLIKEGVPAVPAMHQAAQEVMSMQQQCTSIPKRFGMPMREIWEMQLRLPRRGGRKAEQLMENRRFRAAYDFLLLREQAGEETGNLGQWWTDYQNRSPDQRAAMTENIRDKKIKRRRPRNKPRPDHSTANFPE
ncbi:MAG: polynucleotide adenylyltransferase PcnB [Oceanicoccus sp.]|uniref:polynucleotide adenylyltransferase PcnB n=1 Tax=Oceanicoccus sp. TaxID=2691044 RepID=UPI002630FFDA|nr:polynucleotide adenylyltransferase PcnB [Oceanicoccus sp.]MCP3908183.1 polynucleotide adenylyltransferase PcnB [Oceanicoccus sp.]MDG1773916.1 polynucleotide adenylyltransferase PcnB [Oceanicoccus sp.]